MQDPQTLVLEIVVEGATLKMSAVSQGDFASTVRHYSRVRFLPSLLDTFCQEIIHILNRAGQNGDFNAEAFKSLQKTGRLLWDHLITASVKEKLKGDGFPEPDIVPG